MNYEEVSDQIIKRICQCGWKAYLCGGAVRDAFRDQDPHDFDIVTDCTPTELATIFSDRKVKTVGANFLVTLIDDVEVSTYRSDKNNGPGRFNCITTACQTLEEDLSRRDFTFNALAVCPYTGEVIDIFNGRKDLENKVVRFVGDPKQRIYEDYLRIIRAARFACLIEGRIDPKSFEAMIDLKHYVKEISKERIRLELLKVMKYRKPSIFFNILKQTGVLNYISPELIRLYGHTGGPYHGETLDVHSMLCGDSLSSKDPILRLIGYFHDIAKPAAYRTQTQSFIGHDNIGAYLISNIFKRLKFSNEEAERAYGLVKFHMKPLGSFNTTRSTNRFTTKLQKHNINWKDWLKLKIADNNANLLNSEYSKDKIKDICIKIIKSHKVTNNGTITVKDLAINGNDVMQLLNIKPGKEVGVILNELLNIVIDDPEKNNKEELFKIIKEKGLD